MLKRPQWVKEKIEGREKEIPLQMTVKKKYSMQPDNSYMGMETVSGMNTGPGVDGIIQPGKMVDVQVHEGEGIIPNNAMQGLTGEEFQGLIETLSTGDIDKNKLREAINMPTVSEYQTGGVAGEDQNEFQKTLPTIENMVKDKTSSIASNYNAAKNFLYPKFDTQKTAAPNDPTTFVNAPKGAILPTTVPMVPKSFMENVQTIQEPLTAAPVTREKPRDFNIQVKPPEPQTIQTEEVKVPPDKTVTEFAPPPPPEETPTDTTTKETVTTSTVSPAGEMVHKALQQLLAQSEGVTDTDRKILDFYMQNIDAAEAANLRILEHRISGDPDMSEQGKQAAIRGLQREAAARRSQEAGKMAMSAAERATQATKDVITYGGDVRKYEEITLPESRQNMEIKDWTFENHTKPLSLLEVEELQNKLGADNWDRITEMINDGYSFSTINTELAKMGLEPLTIDEYAAVYKATDLGERNWDRQLGLAEMQLELGDFEAAATSFDNLYPGVNIDFSKLVTKENAEMFNTGLKQMATYIEANYNVDEALDMARVDGTLEFMGVSEEQFARFYNAKKVNALDAQWEEIETTKEYQRLLNSTDPAERQLAQDTRDYYWMNVLGILDRDTLYEYKIYKNGEIDPDYSSVYAKNDAEAQAKVDALGEGYSVEKTGMVSFQDKEALSTELDPNKKLTTDWETFYNTIPDDKKADVNMEDTESDLYKAWEKWQEDNTGGYNDFIKSPTGKLMNLDIKVNKDLLDENNSKILWDAYEENPDLVRDSKYSFAIPDAEYLASNIEHWIQGTGKSGITISSVLKSQLNEAKGQLIDYQSNEGSGTGQLIDVKPSTNTIELTLRLKDGSTKKINIR